jgi:hypothetical protein
VWGFSGSAGNMARSQVYISVASCKGSAAENVDVVADEVYRMVLQNFTTRAVQARRQPWGRLSTSLLTISARRLSVCS